MERLSYKELTQDVAGIVSSKKGDNTVIYDVSKLTSFTDFIVITTVYSKAQMAAILKELREKINERADHIEGESSGGWVLIDYGGVIINLFLPDVREFYGLERLWGDAKECKM